MTENNKTHLGYVSRYDNERQFGFIETEHEKRYFFFIDKTEQRRLKKQGLLDVVHRFCSGDEVEFNLRASLKSKDGIEAYNVNFIKNVRREQLINEAKQSENLVGYLKLIDNEKYFVKHKSSYVFIPIEISEWEIDLHEMYDNRIDKLVNFKLKQTTKIDKLSAFLTDARYRSEYYELKTIMESDCILKATITGKNKHGLFTTVLNGSVSGFVAFIKNKDNLDTTRFEKYSKGDIVNTRIKFFQNKRMVTLSLV